MCIEVVIERGVLETEGVGGYFVCLFVSLRRGSVEFTETHNSGPKTHKHRQSRRGRDSNDSQKSALGPRKANAMTASSVSSS